MSVVADGRLVGDGLGFAPTSIGVSEDSCWGVSTADMARAMMSRLKVSPEILKGRKVELRRVLRRYHRGGERDNSRNRSKLLEFRKSVGRRQPQGP